MSRTNPEELAFNLARFLERRFRSLKLPRPKTLADEIVPDLMREIPSQAFDAVEPWEMGVLFLHDDVDEESIREIQSEITETDANLERGKPITLYLSSFGGSVFAGLALVSTIHEVRRRGRKVNIHIQGCAMSMGSLIAQAGDHRSMEPTAWFMIHEISTALPRSKTSEVRDEAEFLERLELQTCQLYSSRTGKPPEYWRKRFHRKDVYLTAQEALEEGLVDEISTVPAYPRRRRKAA